LQINIITGSELKPLLADNKGKLVVLFTANWCSYCKMLEQEMDCALLDFRVIGVDLTDEEDKAWDDYRIEVVPTALLFAGKTEVGRKAASRSGLRVGDIKSLYESHA